MNQRVIVAATIAGVLVACGKAENPLLRATDGEFARLIEPRSALAPSCAAAFYDPELFVRQYNAVKFIPGSRITAVSEQQKAECITDLQKRASEVGIDGNVKPEHFNDDRVRQRYVAAVKR